MAQGAEREITLLKEYRTRLIADVVTGKLDVREAAGCLTEEPEETEEIHEAEALSGDEEVEGGAILDPESEEVGQ